MLTKNTINPSQSAIAGDREERRAELRIQPLTDFPALRRTLGLDVATGEIATDVTTVVTTVVSIDAATGSSTTPPKPPTPKKPAPKRQPVAKQPSNKTAARKPASSKQTTTRSTSKPPAAKPAATLTEVADRKMPTSPFDRRALLESEAA